jgi:hypothetical protein
MASLDSVDTVDDSVDGRRHAGILLVIEQVPLPTDAGGPACADGSCT